MGRNYRCNCLCHGQDGNVTDSYFSCKNCYAANHMGGLPRQFEETAKPKVKKPYKPRGLKPAATEEKNGKPVSTQSSN